MASSVVAGWSDFPAVAGVSGRAAETIILLSGALAESLIALVPRLSTAQLGWALLVVAALTWALPVSIQLRAALAHSYQRRSLAFLRAALHQLAAVPAVVAAVCLINLHPGGMDWLALGTITSMLVAIFNAWVLLVETVR